MRINKYKCPVFWEEDNGGGGGGGDVADVDILGDAPVDDNSGDGGGDDSSAKEKTTTVDAAELAQRFGDVLKPLFEKKEEQQQQRQQMSPEEAKKALNVWEPSTEFLAKFGNLETQKAAFEELRDALIRQMDTIAQVRLSQEREETAARYNPIVEHMQRVEAEGRQSRFNSTYEQLAKPELAPIISAVVQEQQKAGKKYNNERDAFTAIAKDVEAVIKSHNPDFKLTLSTATSKKSGGGIPVTTGSGGGGGGSAARNNGAPVKAGSKVMAVLGALGT